MPKSTSLDHLPLATIFGRAAEHFGALLGTSAVGFDHASGPDWTAKAVFRLRCDLPLVPTLLKLVEALALIDAGYIGTGDRLWTRHD